MRWPGRRRRALVVVGCVVALAAVVGAGGWLFWLPTWRPGLQADERYGVDVSAHQGAIDWGAVAEDDISFAYIKASEGADFIDRRFGANWMGSHRAGLQRGAYHFYSLCSTGAAQARHFLAVAAPDRAALPPAVDLELAGNCKSRPQPDDLRRELRTFLTLVEAAWSDRVLLYLGDDFEDQYRIRDHVDRRLWQPRVLRRPDVESWVIWQVGSFARVAGIPGRVDLDVVRPCRVDPGPTCPGRRRRAPRASQSPKRTDERPSSGRYPTLARQISAAAGELGAPGDPSAVQTVQVSIDALVGAADVELAPHPPRRDLRRPDTGSAAGCPDRAPATGSAQRPGRPGIEPSPRTGRREGMDGVRVW